MELDHNGMRLRPKWNKTETEKDSIGVRLK